MILQFLQRFKKVSNEMNSRRNQGNVRTRTSPRRSGVLKGYLIESASLAIEAAVTCLQVGDSTNERAIDGERSPGGKNTTILNECWLYRCSPVRILCNFIKKVGTYRSLATFVSKADGVRLCHCTNDANAEQSNEGLEGDHLDHTKVGD